jgi:hypothetical protein
MKLKYNLIAWSLLGFFAAACDPMDDIYNEIDAEGTTNTQTMVEYVLTDADYETISSAAAKAATSDAEKALANAVKTDKALNEFASAEKYVPSIIAKMLPSWGKGSSVGVTYNYQNTPSDYVLEYRTVTNTSLGDKDYEALWGEGSPVKFLAPAHAPATVLPEWLAGQYKDAAKGDLVLVDYKYDDVDPEFTGEDLYSQDFESVTANEDIVLEGWEQVTLKGDRKWQGKNYSSNGYAQFSANGFEGEVDTWLVSPAVAVTSKDAGLSFDIKFGYYNADCLDVLVSDTYAGNGSIDMAQWTSVKDQFTFPEGPANGYNDNFVNVGKAGLEAYNGKSVYVAFRYVGEGPKAKTTTVQLDNVSISSAVLAPTNEKPYNALYQFDGTDWKVKEDSRLVVVTPADYDAMGSPGSHDNFSTSDAPENYLPQFLAQKFPYAQEGDSKAVMYKYYNKVTTMEVDEYLFKESTWVLNNNIELKEKVNFVHNGTEWLFDPTVTKSLASEDYLILENWVKANKDAGYMDAKYGNSEYWFGGSSYYVNFNIQLAKRRSNDPDGVVPADDKEAEAYLLSMVQEGIELILATEYPTAGAQVSGVDCFYVISAKVYNGLETFTYTYTFKGLGNAKFELQGEPEVTK